jgi:hypothetical protein
MYNLFLMSDLKVSYGIRLPSGFSIPHGSIRSKVEWVLASECLIVPISFNFTRNFWTKTLG